MPLCGLHLDDYLANPTNACYPLADICQHGCEMNNKYPGKDVFSEMSGCSWVIIAVAVIVILIFPPAICALTPAIALARCFKKY